MKINALIMGGILAAYGIFYFIFGETVPVNDGFGWDGLTYKCITKDLFTFISVDSGLDRYYIKRIFVSAFLHIVFKLFGIPLEDINILWGFKIYNLALLCVSVFYYYLTAKHLKFKNSTTWLGFCFLFINFAILKQNFYYPVLLDTTIFTISIIQFYYYLKNNLYGVAICSIIGSLTWPSFLYPSLFLILFPVNKGLISNPEKKSRPYSIIALTSLLLIGLIAAYLRREHVLIYGVTELNVQLLPLSLILFLLYVIMAFGPLLKNGYFLSIKKAVKEAHWINVLAAFLIFLIVDLAAFFIPSQKSFAFFILNLLITSVTLPLIFIISHILYFGPVILLMIFYWKHIVKHIKSFGVGLTAYAVFGLLISINSESRRLINAFPVLVFFLLGIINRFEIKMKHMVILFIISIILSKFWFVFNIQEFKDMETGGYQLFPEQKYFMNHGPWMSFEMYIIQGIIVSILGVFVYYIFRKKYCIDEDTVSRQP